MRGFTIRLATKKDLKAVSVFATPIVKGLKFYNREHTARNLYEMSVEDLRDTLKNFKDSIVMAVSKEGDIIGISIHSNTHGHTDWSDFTIVSPRFRKKGVGRALLRYVIKEAKRHGNHKVWGNTHPKNASAIKLLKSMGFRRVGMLRKHAFKQDEILWEKLIK
jgi:ribosomal protein S18 acetylase RimI-like enzyme